MYEHPDLNQHQPKLQEQEDLQWWLQGSFFLTFLEIFTELAIKLMLFNEIETIQTQEV